jgi:hypothetical protein
VDIKVENSSSEYHKGFGALAAFAIKASVKTFLQIQDNLIIETLPKLS